MRRVGGPLLFRAGNVRRSAQRAEVASLTLEALYIEHFAFVYRAATRIGGPSVDPEDVAQEVFIVAHRKLHTFDGSAQVTTWLYAITLNIARSMRIRCWARRARDLELVPPKATSELDRIEVRDAHHIAYEILDAMPTKKREVFILAEFEDLSCAEIAAIVGVQTETVWSRLHYARKEFSERLARRRNAVEGAAARNRKRLSQNGTSSQISGRSAL